MLHDNVPARPKGEKTGSRMAACKGCTQRTRVIGVKKPAGWGSGLGLGKSRQAHTTRPKREGWCSLGVAFRRLKTSNVKMLKGGAYVSSPIFEATFQLQAIAIPVLSTMPAVGQEDRGPSLKLPGWMWSPPHIDKMAPLTLPPSRNGERPPPSKSGSAAVRTLEIRNVLVCVEKDQRDRSMTRDLGKGRRHRPAPATDGKRKASPGLIRTALARMVATRETNMLQKNPSTEDESGNSMNQTEAEKANGRRRGGIHTDQQLASRLEAEETAQDCAGS
ncbi:uncharacterized protein LACBIDRAFT_321045 [Laccaria bicolor S238N-H82]|uniref:Predicted protein n=1 Tax=Laccaria bicolor (strain S238N-H82 / ATCC MYA-4686) TaxID=486041 RepID=B0CNK9_LACBS|nr:uncharacterized protein LACBIDRAFT_321045 [Laccaria bicolor S238N-H82]EDR15327.1 predicted protein [Laccaria bicolor S238N-H82]|eukprot:XP_001873535.1 predicted protein [Laccaria bicolor S238N-H82]